MESNEAVVPYANLFPPLWSKNGVSQQGERNAHGEMSGLNGFEFLRYVWTRFVARRAEYEKPIDRTSYVFPVPHRNFLVIYRCEDIGIEEGEEGGVRLLTKYFIDTKTRLEALHAIYAEETGDDEEAAADKKARFKAAFEPCDATADIDFEDVLQAYSRFMANNSTLYQARFANYRRYTRMAKDLFAYYEHLAQDEETERGMEETGSPSPPQQQQQQSRRRGERGVTVEEARQGSSQSDAFFVDKNRENLRLLIEERVGPTTADYQSPLLRDEDFFRSGQRMTKEEVQRMLRRYPAYWAKMLNTEVSVTAPEVYRVVDALAAGDLTNETKLARLQEILLEAHPQFVLKATPVTEDMYTEIAHEIRCGYYLNELNLGYAHTLSPHFMQIVDWWAALRKDVPPQTLQPKLRLDQYGVWQFMVAERLDEAISKHVCGGRGLEGLRHRLFQVFDALEVAWLANQYMHYDLHDGNVYLKNLQPSSTLYDKNLIYKRQSNDTEWYRLDATILANQIVKILDFGRNRMVVPRPGDDKIQEDRKSLAHTHSQLLFQPGFERYGLTKTPNRSWDIRRLLIELLHYLKPAEIDEMQSHADFGAFCDMVDSVFLFQQTGKILHAAMQQDSRKKDTVVELRANSFYKKAFVADVSSTAALLATAKQWPSKNTLDTFFGLYRDIVAYSEMDTGATPSTCLDSRFFDALKQTEIVDSTRNVVVSFPTADLSATQLPPLAMSASLGEEVARVAPEPPKTMMMHRGSGREAPRCHRCGKLALKTSFYKSERLNWCGPVCYQFHYSHQGRTTVG